MLVLFETPAGYAIFKLLDEKKLQQSDDLYEDFKVKTFLFYGKFKRSENISQQEESFDCSVT